jgi:PAS domain S-box-containing protein
MYSRDSTVDVDLGETVEGASDLVFAVDDQGRVTYANAASRALLGVEPAEAVGTHWSAYVHPESLERAAGLWQRLVAGEAQQGIEVRLRRRDGRDVHVLFDGVPRFDTAGRFLGGHGLIHRLAGPRPPAEREGLLERMASLGSFSRALAAKPETPAVLETFGRCPASLGIDACWLALCEEGPPGIRAVAHYGADAEALAEAALAAYESQQGWTPTARAIQARQTVLEDLGREEPGAPAWRQEAQARGYRAMAVVPLAYGDRVLGAVHAYSRTAGFFDGWRLFLVEAQAQIAAAAVAGAQALERARQAETRFLDLVEGLPCVVYVARPVWPPTILFISRNVERYIGYKPEEFYADPTLIMQFIHPEDRERVAEGIRRSFREPEPYTLEFRVVHRNGRDILHASFRSAPLLDSQGRVVLRQGLITDTTEQKRLEQEVLQSQRLAAVGEMAAMMAHEIRNPLAGMSLALRTLQGSLGEPEVVQECLEDLEHCLQRINATVSRALDFTKARPLMLRRCALPQAIQAAQRLTATYIRKNQIDLSVECAPDLPDFLGDPDQLEQVFVNLILNACQAMPGGGHLTLRAWAEADGLRAEVADTGVGIEPACLDHIFDAFYSGFANGTGLGLPLCQRIVAAHGGRIRVTSAPGEGSTFAIELPLERADATRPPR